MTDKKNAFDLLRILLAVSVLVTHALLIGGYQLRDPLSVLSKDQTNFAEFGVMGFFTLSGFLITASFERSKNVLVFASHRILRIFPAFWVCLLVTAFVLAPLIYSIKTGPFSTYFASYGGNALGYIYHNFFLKINQWSIGNVLSAAPYKESLNGSLWSLFPEMQCYCFTLVVGWCGLLKKNSTPYLVLSIAIFIFFAISFNFIKNYGPTFLILSPALKLYTAYIAGSLVYVFGDRLLLDKKETMFMAGFTLLLIKFGGFHLLSPLLIAITLINIFRLFEFRMKYDISYGLYIYSFVVEQLLAQLIGNRWPVFVFIVFTLAISGILALASYILIEKPAINLKKRTDPLLSRVFGTGKTL